MTTIDCCERCGEKLNPKTLEWLELDTRTNRFHWPEDFPASGLSQGAFPFGTACAKAVIANGGANVRIRSAS